MTNNLVIFDIDGTLTQTACLDSRTYSAAFMEYFGIDKINNNWAEYRYSTDSGFAIELFEKHVGRKPNLDEIQTIKNKFFNLLESQIRNNKLHCQPLLGAQTIFERIARLTCWDIAIATGCWRDSAFIKLKYANLPHHNIPLGCGDDHIERYEIINIAIERAKNHYKQKQYKTVVYVGDKHWDYKASQKLRVKFIGVGEEFALNERVDFPTIKDYSSNNLLMYLDDFAVDKMVAV